MCDAVLTFVQPVAGAALLFGFPVEYVAVAGGVVGVVFLGVVFVCCRRQSGKGKEEEDDLPIEITVARAAPARAAPAPKQPKARRAVPPPEEDVAPVVNPIRVVPSHMAPPPPPPPPPPVAFAVPVGFSPGGAAPTAPRVVAFSSSNPIARRQLPLPPPPPM